MHSLTGSMSELPSVPVEEAVLLLRVCSAQPLTGYDTIRHTAPPVCMYVYMYVRIYVCMYMYVWNSVCRVSHTQQPHHTHSIGVCMTKIDI